MPWQAHGSVSLPLHTGYPLKLQGAVAVQKSFHALHSLAGSCVEQPVHVFRGAGGGGVQSHVVMLGHVAGSGEGVP